MTLTLLVFIPLLGAVISMFLPKENADLHRKWGLAVSLIGLIIALSLWGPFDSAASGLQFEESASWIPSLGISYHLGIDGLSYPMLLITAIVSVLAVLAS